MKELMKLLLPLFCLFAFGCSTTSQGRLRTYGTWEVSSETGHRFVFPEGVNAPVTMTHLTDLTVLSVPHKTEKIDIPLRIPKEAFLTKGHYVFKPEVLGQPYRAELDRREEISIGERVWTQEGCSYTQVENVCKVRTKTDPLEGVKTEHSCEPESVEETGWKTVYFRPVTTLVFLDLSFIAPAGSSPLATIKGTEVIKDRIIDGSSDCR